MINVDFQSKDGLIHAFPDEAACIDHLERLRWDGFVTSPFDPVSTVYVCANNRYRCKNTGKYFNAKTGTLFHNSRIPLQKWFLAIWTISRSKRGITSVALAETLELTQKTAWFMLQRIKNGLDTESLQKARTKTAKKKKGAQHLADIKVTADKDRMAMHEWLQLLKK